MQVIFTFTLNTETKEASMAGNVEPEAALQILQQLVIAQAMQRARQSEADKKVAKGKK